MPDYVYVLCLHRGLQLGTEFFVQVLGRYRLVSATLRPYIFDRVFRLSVGHSSTEWCTAQILNTGQTVTIRTSPSRRSGVLGQCGVRVTLSDVQFGNRHAMLSRRSQRDVSVSDNIQSEGVVEP